MPWYCSQCQSAATSESCKAPLSSIVSGAISRRKVLSLFWPWNIFGLSQYYYYYRVLRASRRQPHLLHVSAVDRRQTWSMDKSWQCVTLSGFLHSDHWRLWRSKPGSRIVGSTTKVELTTVADCQSSLHRPTRWPSINELKVPITAQPSPVSYTVLSETLNSTLHSYKKYKHWKTINTTIQTLTKCRKRTKCKKKNEKTTRTVLLTGGHSDRLCLNHHH